VATRRESCLRLAGQVRSEPGNTDLFAVAQPEARRIADELDSRPDERSREVLDLEGPTERFQPAVVLAG
jgi:hypothetical protein